VSDFDAMTPSPGLPDFEQSQDDEQTQDYGPNNEKLPERLWGALADLLLRFETANRTSRIEEVRRIQRGREFEKGNQNIFWSERSKRWSPISSSGGVLSAQHDNDELQRYDYVNNIYRTHLQITTAVLTQNPTHIFFGPRSYSHSEDVATAKAAEDVSKFIADNNRLDIQQQKVARYFFNDGGCASYVEFEVDGDKYGYNTKNRTAPVQKKITDDSFRCPQCGYQETLQDGWSPDQVPPACPQCGGPLAPEHVAIGTIATVDQVVGQDQSARGMEKIEYIGMLEFVRPYYAENLEECPYVTWETEMHESFLKSMYPIAEDKIKAGANVDGDAVNSVARQARMALRATSYGRYHPEGSSQLVTFRRTWFRPFAFFGIDDKKLRGELQALFPTGCYFAMAGDVYCESRDECMDDKWALRYATEGDGMQRHGIGYDLIDIQRRLNTEENITTETLEHGIPALFLDTQVVDQDAYISGGALPGATYGAIARPGMSLGDAFHETAPAQISPQLPPHTAQLKQDAQFSTGNLPPLFGASTPGNETASGIAIVKDSAYGRLALFKRSMNEFYIDTMLNAIECFRTNRQENVEFSIIGPGGKLDSGVIRLDQLRGDMYARADANDAYPMSLTQQREMFAGLLQNQAPMIMGLMGYAPNFDNMKLLMGMKDLRLPGEDPRRKQLREIRKMLQGQQVMVNGIMDDHAAEAQTIRDWYSSDEGQDAEESNPQGVQLVQQHMMQHLAAAAQVAAVTQEMAPGQTPAGAQAAAGGPPAPPGAGGAQPAPGPPQ
jgi:hypothetical protein